MRFHPLEARFLSWHRFLLLMAFFVGWLTQPTTAFPAEQDPNAPLVAQLVAQINERNEFGPKGVEAARLADQLVALQKVNHRPNSEPVARALEVAYIAYYSAEDPLRTLAAIEELAACYRALYGENSWQEKWIAIRRIEFEWLLTNCTHEDRVRIGSINQGDHFKKIWALLNANRLDEAKPLIEQGKQEIVRMFLNCRVPGEWQWNYTFYLEMDSVVAEKEDRLADAITSQAQAVEVMARTGGMVGRLQGSQLERLALLHLAVGDLDAAELRFRQALQSRREVDTPKSYSYHLTLVNLAATLSRKGDHGAAKTIADEYLAFANSDLSSVEQKAQLFSAASNVALLAGRYDETIRLCQNALQLISTRAEWAGTDRHYGPTINLGHAYYNLRQYDQAIVQYQKLLEWSEKKRLPQNSRYLELFLAKCYIQKDQLDLAEKAMRRAVDLGVLKLQPTVNAFKEYETCRHLLFVRRLTIAYQSRDFDRVDTLLQGRLQELESSGKSRTYEAHRTRQDLSMLARIKALSTEDYRQWQEAKTLAEAILGPDLSLQERIDKATIAEKSYNDLGLSDDYNVSLMTARRGIALRAIGKPKEAIPVLQQATAIFDKQWSSAEPPELVAFAWLEFGRALRTQQSSLAESIVTLQRAATIAEQLSASETYQMSGSVAGFHADALHELADAQRWIGRLDAAETTAQSLIALRQRISGPVSYKMLEALRLQADLSFMRANYDAAATRYLDILKLHKQLGTSDKVQGVDLVGLGMSLASLQRTAEAEPKLREGLKLLEEHKKGDYWNIGRGYRFLGDVCVATNRLDEAEQYYQKVIAMWEAVDGFPQRLLRSVRESLAGLFYRRAFALERAGEPAQAVEFRKKARPSLIAAAGDQSEVVLTCNAWIRSDETWSQLAPEASKQIQLGIEELVRLEELIKQNRYADVIAPLEGLAALFEKQLGPADIRTFLAWRMCSDSLVKASRYEEGLVAADKAMAISRTMNGREDDIAASLYFLKGNSYWALGRISESADAYLRSLTIYREIGDSAAMNYAVALLQFARCRMEEDRAVEVVPQVRHATGILRNMVRQRPDLYVGALCRSAELSARLGDIQLAELYLQEAASLVDRTNQRGRDIEELLLCAETRTLVAAGKYDEAEEASRRWLALAGKLWNAQVPTHRVALHWRAMILCRNGQFDLANPIAQQVLQTAKASPGEEIAAVGQSLLLLGEAQMGAGDYPAALRYTREAIAELEKAVRPGHERLMAAREQLARIEWSLGNEPAARAARQQNLSDARARFDQLTTVANSDQMIVLAQTMRQTLYDYLSLPIDSATNVALYEEVLHWKGAAFLKQRSLREAMRDPKNATLVRQWQQAASTLATSALRPPYSEGMGAWLEQLSMQRLELGRLDSLMSQFAKPLPAVKARDIQAALRDNEVLIDIVAYPHVSPDPNARGQWLKSQRYAFFVLTKDRDVHRVDVTDGEKVTALVEEWRKVLDAGGHAEPSVCLNEGLPQLRLLGVQLRDLIWTPLTEYTANKKLVILSPDAALTALPFGALPASDPQTFLIEEKAFMVIPAPRLLVERRAAPVLDPSLLVVGQVDYGSRPGELPASPSIAKVALGGFTKLTDDDIECGAVLEHFQQKFGQSKHEYVIRDAATEANFRAQANAHRWIHVSTHGFFQETFTLQNLMSRMLPALPGLSNREPQPVSSYGLGTLGHPGLQCGIGLAGANVPNRPGEDDGILSALEVSMMDLSSVDGVVLSACQTALGTIRDGEGVLGLQRAFHQAGARSVIATLWSVPVTQTIQLLNAYYGVRWQDDLDGAFALQTAQAMFIEQARLNDPERLPAHTEHPFFWAGFSLSANGVER